MTMCKLSINYKSCEIRDILSKIVRISGFSVDGESRKLFTIFFACQTREK